MRSARLERVTTKTTTTMKFKSLLLVISFLTVSIISFSQVQKASFDFNENKGQLNKVVKYHCKLHIGDIYFKDNQFSFDLFSAEELDVFYSHKHHKGNDTEDHEDSQILNKHVYNMKFLGANSNNTIVTSKKNKYYRNYYQGNNPDRWASNVQSYQKIGYQNIYNGIDINIYSTNNHLKYDFVVAVGAETDDIKVEYEGVKNLKLENGGLEIILSNGVVRELKPYAYQIIDDKQHEVVCEFVIEDNILSYNFPYGYDSGKKLVIDPTLVFATLTGSPTDNWGFTATYDDAGNFYAGGIALGNGTGPNFGLTANYPVTGGAYQTTFAGFVDVAISKFSTNGSALIYSTYIGGSEMEEPHSLIVDDQDNLIIMGATSSTNFPVDPNAYQTTFGGGSFLSNLDGINWNNGSDIFISKLDATGSTLIGSTYLGGTGNDGLSLDGQLNFNYADHARGEVILDGNNDVYIASSTNSANFPTTPSSHSQSLSGGYDGVVCKLNPTLSNLTWSTYIGGSQGDAAFSVRIDTVNSKTFICGGTVSNNIGATAGVIGPTYSGAVDGYIAKFDNTNGSLDALSYIGTNAYDQSYIIEVDQYQDVYVVGQTKGAYPVSPTIYNNPGSAQFIHKVNNDLTVTDFSTVFGDGSNLTIDISITAFLVDNCDNIYVGGWGGNVSPAQEGNTLGLPTTANAIQSTTDGSDFYFIVLDRDAQNLLYATYYGSPTALEHVDGGTSRFDKNGTIYQAVCAACGGNNFPTTPGAYSTVNGATNCNYGGIKIDMDFQGVIANAIPPPNQIQCGAPYNLNFSAGTPAPPNNYWDFGDGLGTAVDDNNPAYTYADTGSYTVMYVAIDSATCNIVDTAYFNVTVLLNDSLDAQFSFPVPDPCADSMLVQLDFTGSGADSLFWDMGNGTTFINDTSITYYYTTPGTYILTFEAYDTLCNNSLTLIDTVFFNPVFSTVNAVPPPPILLCSTPYIVNFTGNTPSSPNSYWDFGDFVGTDTTANPTYTYGAAGNYTVMYVAIDSSTCNIADTVYFPVVLTVAPPFSATLDFDPPLPCSSLDSFTVDLLFTGSGADSLVWDLGDGTQITNIDSLTYLYSNSGTYTVTMTAYNFLCNFVETIQNEVTFIDFKGTESIIPNVFTPNGDGMNDELQFVGIDQTAEYSIQIFNRWGNKVYEGTDALAHWDGTGHDDGTYFYILKYTDVCSSEEKMEKGTVTLLK